VSLAALRRIRDPLAWMRKVCGALAGTTEVVSWGHPNFRAGGRTFTVFEIYKGRPCIAIATDPEEQSLLIERFGLFRTPYLGSRGWVSAWVDQPAPFQLMGELIRRAYRRNIEKTRSRKTVRSSARRTVRRRARGSRPETDSAR